MNRKGQTLIVFTLLLPILLLLMAFVIDTGFILKESTRLNSTTKTILKTTFENRRDGSYREEVEQIFKKNDIPITNLQVIVQEDAVQISNSYYVSSIFGKIIGIKEYEIKTDMKARLVDTDLVIKKE